MIIVGLTIPEWAEDLVTIGRLNMWTMRGLGTEMLPFTMGSGEQVSGMHNRVILILPEGSRLMYPYMMVR